MKTPLNVGFLQTLVTNLPFLRQILTSKNESEPTHHMMSIFPLVRIQLSFVQFSLLCYEFCILSKTECKSIYYHFRRDHESSSFRKLARNNWICRKTFDFF